MPNPDPTPAERIRAKMIEVEWDHADLADWLEVTEDKAVELLAGRLAITPAIAAGLARAFGTSAEVWLNLQRVYDEAEPAARAELKRITPPNAELLKLADRAPAPEEWLDEA